MRVETAWIIVILGVAAAVDAYAESPLPSSIADSVVDGGGSEAVGEGEAEAASPEPEPLPPSASESDIVAPADVHVVPPGGFPYSPMPATPAPRIIKYIAAPEDTVDSLAERFGADRDQIIRKNRLSKKNPRVRGGKKLEIEATRFPIPRLRVRYVVEQGDTWNTIAEGLGLSVAQLKRYNRHARRLRHLPPKTRLSAWVDSALPQMATDATPQWTFGPTVPKGSLSYGYPHWGRMTGPVALPESPLYTIRTPDAAYGSTHALEVVQHAVAAFRHESGYPGEVLICSISKKRGRRFPPHKSHQSGRDIDIGLVAYPGFPQGTGKKAHGGKVDWAATWLLMRHFIETDQVTYIFLSYHLQPLLYEAAQALGATDAELARAIQWPAPRGKTSAIIRHARGHTGHFHVRVKCSPDAPRCKGH